MGFASGIYIKLSEEHAATSLPSHHWHLGKFAESGTHATDQADNVFASHLERALAGATKQQQL